MEQREDYILSIAETGASVLCENDCKIEFWVKEKTPFEIYINGELAGAFSPTQDSNVIFFAIPDDEDNA